MTLTDRAIALEILSDMVEATVSPILDLSELETLLDAAAVSSLWVAVTSYAFGEIAQPTAGKRNGHRFKVVKLTGGSTSGATEPAWPDTRDGEVVDGNLTWKEVGTDFDSLWDLNSAARAGWLLKRGRVATCTDFKQDGVSFTSSQMFDHCTQMAMTYYSPQIA